MTSSEFGATRELIPLSDSELADWLQVAPSSIAEWASGRKKVPRDVARILAVVAAGIRQETLLSGSGLPDCEWLNQNLTPSRAAPVALRRLNRDVWNHRKSCPTCLARERHWRRLKESGVEPRPDQYFGRGWRIMLAIEKVWFVVVWVALLAIATADHLWGEPTLWLVLAAPVGLWIYTRWRHRWR